MRALARLCVRRLGFAALVGSAIVWAVLSVALPGEALACPVCAGDAGNNYTFLKLGALMSLVPFAIVGAILWVVRHAPRDEGREDVPARVR
jgi:hypothetical protein